MLTPAAWRRCTRAAAASVLCLTFSGSALAEPGIAVFSPPTVIELGATQFPTTVAIADLDGDGRSDLVYMVGGTQGTPTTLTSQLNLGGGTFAPAQHLTVDGFGLLHMADVTRDGYVDAIVRRQGEFRVYAGNGTGGFTVHSTVAYGVASQPTAFHLADVNDDGAADLLMAAWACCQDTPAIHIRLNDGTGAFGTATGMSTGSGHAFKLAIGDVNGDAVPDIVATNTNTTSSRGGAILPNISVLLGDGEGGFSVRPAQPLIRGVEIALADMDVDGDLDLVTVGGDAGIATAFNDGSGTFAGTTVLSDTPLFTGTGAPLVGHVKGFGPPDLAGIAGSSPWTQPGIFFTGRAVGLPDSFRALGQGATGSEQIAIGDLNGDGKLDVVTTERLSHTVSIWLQPSQPVADAGADSAVPADFSDSATVTLDGSASTGAALTYTWREGTTVLATGPSPTASVPLYGLGRHVVLLTVTSGGIDHSAMVQYDLTVPDRTPAEVVTQLDTLDARMAALEASASDIGALSEQVDAVAQDLGVLVGAIAALGARADAAEGTGELLRALVRHVLFRLPASVQLATAARDEATAAITAAEASGADTARIQRARDHLNRGLEHLASDNYAQAVDAFARAYSSL